MANLALSGLTIVVTRPREQAAQLAQLIESAGGHPFLFALLDIAPAQNTKALQQQISQLAKCDLAIFISPNAVKFGMAAIAAAGAWPAQIKVATVGQSSANALRELGIAQVITPTQRFDSESLLALPALKNVSGWRVMIFRGDGGRELLGDTLKARGAAVEYVTCYQRSKPQQTPNALLDAKPAAITITSSEALQNLWEILDGAARKRLSDTPIFAPHPRIIELAVKQGWKYAHLTDAGDPGLLTALIAWAKHRTEII